MQANPSRLGQWLAEWRDYLFTKLPRPPKEQRYDPDLTSRSFMTLSLNDAYKADALVEKPKKKVSNLPNKKKAAG